MSSAILDVASFMTPSLPRKVATALSYELAKLNGGGTRQRWIADRFRMDLDLGDWLQRLYYLGELDETELALLLAVAPKGGTIVDVGANVGLYALAAAAAVGASGRVEAFEPSPLNLEPLHRNIALNAFDQIRVHELALSDEPGLLKLFVPPVHRGGPSGATRVADPGGWKQVGIVPSVRLDDALSPSRLDFLKTDAEGHDGKILRGAWGLVEKHRPIVQAELLAHDLEPVGRDFRAAGYLVFAMAGGELHEKEAPTRAGMNYVFVPREHPAASVLRRPLPRPFARRISRGRP